MPPASASRHPIAPPHPKRTPTRSHTTREAGPPLGSAESHGAALGALSVVIERHGDVGTIVLAGVLEASTSAWVTRALARLESTRPCRIAIDVARLEAIDRSGWAAIRDAVRRCRSRDVPLEMVLGRAPVARAHFDEEAMNRANVLAAGNLEAQLIANAGDAFIVADAQGVSRFWNPAAESMFGYSSDDAIGSTLDIIVPEPQRRAHWDGYFKTMASGETQYGGKTLSVPAMRADGTRLSVAFTVALLHDADGTVAGIGAVMRDVTTEWEQKRDARRRIASLEQELSALRGSEL